MEKKAFVSKELIESIVKDYPTPFHIYDEKGIRENAMALKAAFAWNKGYKEFFAVKATPNPFLMRILKECGCGCDCSSYTELMLSDAVGVRGEDIMFSSNVTPAEDFVLAAKVLGIPDFKIIVKHIIPNILGMLITNLCMAIPGAIFQEAFLSYVGLGVTPPNCSWGVICKEGIAYLRNSPHQVLIPAFFVCTTMLALNLLGNGLRDAVDPKLRGTE